MAAGTRSEFVDFVKPPGAVRIKLYDPTHPPHDQHKNSASDPAKALPQGFLDAMTVRDEVFVQEQGVPRERELDEDDARAFHWVVYASIPTKSSSATTQPTPPIQHSTDRRTSLGANASTAAAAAAISASNTPTSTKIPVGTIRLIPPPHAAIPPPYDNAPSPSEDDPNHKSSEEVMAAIDEPYIRLSRLAVIKEYRKTGISQLLINTALSFARDNPYNVLPSVNPSKVEAMRQEMPSSHGAGSNTEFKGLVLAHAQRGTQKLWRKWGFATDDSLGVWMDEDIPHVAMWKRMDVSSGRRASRVLLPSSLALGL